MYVAWEPDEVVSAVGSCVSAFEPGVVVEIDNATFS